MTHRIALIVSPYFPPSTLAGAHRARHLAKHLGAAGWTPLVLCVHEDRHEERADPALAALVPENTEIVKVGAIRARSSRLVGIGEISLRAWPQLRSAMFRLLATRPVGVVFITGSPYFPMLFAPAIKRRFGIPVVLDFQDPWASSWGAAQPRLSKAGVHHALATALEPRALRGADFVTSVSEVQNQEMARSYPWLDASRMAGIPIGGDPDDFAALRATATIGEVGLAPGFINLSYVGAFLPRAHESVATLFRAFAGFREKEPEIAARVRLNFIGTSNQPDDTKSYRVLPLAAAAGISASVNEVPQRLPYLEALHIVSRSDGLLLIGSNEPHYTASKIYPSLMSGRPYLSLFHRSSSAHAILSSAGGGRALAFASSEELADLEQPLVDALRTLVTAPASLGHADPASYAPYEAGAIARRFADIFDRLAAERAVRGVGQEPLR